MPKRFSDGKLDCLKELTQALNKNSGINRQHILRRFHVSQINARATSQYTHRQNIPDQ